MSDQPASRQPTIGVAIAVPEPYAGHLQRARASFGDPLALSIPTHITLVPPTPVDVADLGPVSAHLARVAAGWTAFDVALHGTSTFRPVSPVVFVRIVEGADRCSGLESAIRQGPLDRELRFPYHPHITVAHDVEEPALDRAARTLAGFSARFRVTGFSLYLHGGDGVWRPSQAFPFAVAPDGRAAPERGPAAVGHGGRVTGHGGTAGAAPGGAAAPGGPAVGRGGAGRA